MRMLYAIGLGLFCVYGAHGSAQNGPRDAVANRMADLLVPGAYTDYIAANAPVPRKVNPRVESPDAPLPVYQVAPPHVTMPSLRAVTPGNLLEVPLAEYRADPVRPQAIVLPAGPMVRLPSINVETPIPLPILSKPERDRASLADPTLEMSVAAALKPFSANRPPPQSAPPVNLPDPFENSQAVRLRVIPDELPMPPPITPR